MVLVVLLLPALLTICFFAVNLAYMVLLRTQLQSAVDAAARAAASTFSATNSEYTAVAAAQQIALNYRIGGGALEIDAADVEFGESVRPAEDARYQFTAGGAQPNACRVTASLGSTPLFAAGLFGGAGFSPVRSATATFANVDICLVLDRSSSMKLPVNDRIGLMSLSSPLFCLIPQLNSRWAALDVAVDAFADIIEGTIADEHVAVVTYASDYDDGRGCFPGIFSTETAVDVGLTGDLSLVRRAMNTLSNSRWNGMTNIHAGIVRGVDVLTDPIAARPNVNKMMILLTDGVYTGDDPLPYAQAAAVEGIKIHTVTFSDGANQVDMQAVAGATGGRHYHAPDAATLEQIFRELAAMSVMLTE